MRVDRREGVEDHLLLGHLHGRSNVLHDATGVQRAFFDDPGKKLGKNAFQIGVEGTAVLLHHAEQQVQMTQTDLRRLLGVQQQRLRDQTVQTVAVLLDDRTEIDLLVHGQQIAIFPG